MVKHIRMCTCTCTQYLVYLSFVPVLPEIIRFHMSRMQIGQYVKCKSFWTPACAHAYALKIWV